MINLKNNLTGKKRILLIAFILTIGIIFTSFSILEVKRSHAIDSHINIPDQAQAQPDLEELEDEPEDELEEEPEPEDELEPEELDLDEENLTDLIEEDINLDDGEESQEKIEDNYAISDKFKEGKVAYLTFDDGPSPSVTPMILEILEDRGIDATFFVVGIMAEQNPHIINRIHESGHVLGNHSYSHNYEYIYKNTSNLKDDLIRWENTIKNILDQDYMTNLFRFPGGSFDRKKGYHNTAKSLGYEIFDWNVVNGDGEVADPSKERLIQRFKETIIDKRNPIILMHDTDAKMTTVETLNEIIDFLIKEGYVFDTLNYYKER